MADWVDIALRLTVATGAGALLGFERSRQDRAIMGFRTLGLVGLASCIAVQAIMCRSLPQMNADAAGQVIQGVLSGVGFIGAGALLHGGSDKQVHGLARAAGIWVSAALGSAAALTIWPLIAVGTGLAILVLLIGAPTPGTCQYDAYLSKAARNLNKQGTVQWKMRRLITTGGRTSIAKWRRERPIAIMPRSIPGLPECTRQPL